MADKMAPGDAKLKNPVKTSTSAISLASSFACYVDVHVPVSTILLRLVTICAFVAILAAGLIIRLYVEPPRMSANHNPYNSSSVNLLNNTTPSPFDFKGIAMVYNQTLMSSLKFTKWSDGEVSDLLNGHGE